MKLFSCGMAALALFVMAPGGIAQAQPADLSKLDIVERSTPAGPVALVAGSPISRDAFLALYRDRLQTLMLGNPAADVRNEDRVRIAIAALIQLVQEEFLYIEAEARGLTASEAAVEAAYQEEIERIRRVVRTREGGALTEEQILAAAGSTREASIEEVRRSLLVEQAFAAIAQESNVEVTDAEVREFYDAQRERFRRPEAVRFRQVFIRPEGAPAPAEGQWARAREEAERALARIRAGEAIGAVAREMSDAPDAQNDGEPGLMPMDEMPPFLAEPLSTMNPGELSDVIRSEFGFHIVQLIELETGSEVSFEEARDTIRTAVRSSKHQEAVRAWTEAKMDEPGLVRVFLELDRTLAALEGDDAPSS